MSIALHAEATFFQSDASTSDSDIHELIESHIPIVRNVVERLRARLPSHADLGDLFSVGVTGLIAAASNYSAERANTFAGYAMQRIRGAIFDELRKSDTRPRRARLKARRIGEVTAELEQKCGRPATDEEVRVELGLTRKAFTRWQLAAQQGVFLSLDEPHPTQDGGGLSLHEAIEDENTTAASVDLERSEIRALLADRILKLNVRQQKILAFYYYEGLRFAEIAEVFGVSESRICQIHGQALKALRVLFADEINQ